MSEFCKDRNTATYCYAIHRDTDHPHAQVALTGTKRDLWMDKKTANSSASAPRAVPRPAS